MIGRHRGMPVGMAVVGVLFVVHYVDCFAGKGVRVSSGGLNSLLDVVPLQAKIVLAGTLFLK